MSLPLTAIPSGSTVLVIGATSFIGSHIIQRFLALGYKVRGTDYDISKASFLTSETFASYATNGSFEFIHVPDILTENAFDTAIKGVSAVVYVSSIQLDPDPHNVIPQNANAVVNALKAAVEEHSVVRFVQTSSLGAAFTPDSDPSIRLDANSWNDSAVELAWAPPPYDWSRAGVIYIASKVAAEKALWKFVEEEKPRFTVNSVLPFFVMGKLLSKAQNMSSNMMIRDLWNGDDNLLRTFETYSYVNVRNVALIHAAAVLAPEVVNQRVYAVAEHCNWNDVLGIMRKKYPERRFMDDLRDLGRFTGKVDNSLGTKLLKKWGGQDGWIPLETGVKESLEGLDIVSS